MSAHAQWLAAEQAMQRRDFVDALKRYRCALDIDGSHVPSLIGLSTALTRLGHHCDARLATLEAFDQQPRSAPLLYAIAQRLRYFHEFDRLVACLSSPVFGDTAPASVLAQAASMLMSIGAHDEATVLAERGLKRQSKDATLMYVRGNLHLFRGETDLAEQCYEASLQADPGLFQSMHMLTLVRPATTERNHVQRLRGLLGQMQPGGPGEVYLSFALHKQLHELGRYDEAWVALEHGCVAKRKQVRYAAANTEQLVECLTVVCDRHFVSQQSRVEQPTVPIFIVGMHRSGTTLLERMLAGHSQIGDAGETSAFHGEIELAVDAAAPEGLSPAFVERLRHADFDAIAQGYARKARWLSRGNPLFTEKLPQNFFNIGFIAKAMPQAKFLHMTRDPMDTCFSNLRQLFSGAAPYSFDQAELGAFYLLYLRMMEHWRQVLPGRVLDVNYDSLISDPDATARRVAAHCGVAFEASMLDIARSSGTVATPSATVARGSFQRDRGQAWRHYRQHLHVLEEAIAPAYR